MTDTQTICTTVIVVALIVTAAATYLIDTGRSKK